MEIYSIVIHSTIEELSWQGVTLFTFRPEGKILPNGRQV